MQEKFFLNKKIRSEIPALPYSEIKNAILGKDYDLSLNFVGETTSRKLNLTYREKDYPTNVLSFPLEKNIGEIYICPKKARSELKKFETNFKKHIAHLFIHGLLHLKGMEHGVTMESKEKYFLKLFKI